MAQHHRIFEKDEPKLFRTLRRTLRVIWPMIVIEEDTAYGKTIKKLPKEYFQQGFAFSVFPCKLKDKRWNQKTEGGRDWRKNACLEVHVREVGMWFEIDSVWYPI